MNVRSAGTLGSMGLLTILQLDIVRSRERSGLVLIDQLSQRRSEPEAQAHMSQAFCVSQPSDIYI